MMGTRHLLPMLLLLTFGPVAAQAQSFNCNYARSPDEILICQAPELSALDEQMSSVYFRLRNRLFGRERQALEADQANWLRSRRDCGRDAPCIAESYRQRIAELQRY